MEKKSLEEFKQINCLLKEMNEERTKRKKKSDVKEIGGNEPLIFADGSTIYLTPIDFLGTRPGLFLNLRQLLYENLQNIPNQPKTLQSLLMTTFCAEPSFVNPIISQNLPFCLVTHSKTPGVKKPSANFTVISPSIPGAFGSFHAKLFLLNFPGRLRVVVTSANLIQCDWSKLGQIIWFQDFFECPQVVESEFKSTLEGFLGGLLGSVYDIKQELGIDLNKFDFATAKVKLVTSVPGRFQTPCQYGLGKLREIVKKEYSGCMYQCSSIGSFSASTVENFLLMTAGNSEARLDLVFPSYKNVQDSFLGPDGAGVFFVRKEHYEKKGFPKDSFCQFEGTEDLSGHLSHSKVMILHDQFQVQDSTILYFGSHNFSGAAWGALEKGGKQISIKNYEIGVVFESKPGSSEEKLRIIQRLPFSFPPKRYLPSDRPFYIDSDFGN